MEHGQHHDECNHEHGQLDDGRDHERCSMISSMKIRVAQSSVMGKHGATW